MIRVSIILIVIGTVGNFSKGSDSLWEITRIRLSVEVVRETAWPEYCGKLWVCEDSREGTYWACSGWLLPAVD